MDIPQRDEDISAATELALKARFRAGGWQLTCELTAIGGTFVKRVLAALAPIDPDDKPGISKETVSEIGETCPMWSRCPLLATFEEADPGVRPCRFDGNVGGRR